MQLRLVLLLTFVACDPSQPPTDDAAGETIDETAEDARDDTLDVPPLEVADAPRAGPPAQW